MSENITEKKSTGTGTIVLGIIAAVAVWYGIYMQLLPFSEWFSYTLLKQSPESHLGSAVQFFVYDTPKVLMLLLIVVFFVGILRSFVTVDRTRKILAGRRESAGNVLAALLGVVTPFCSCSAVPLFIGFMTAGVPLGVTFSFLISAPMVNEIALVLLYGLLGWKVAALYFATGIMIAIVAGWVMGRMNLERHVEDWVMEIRAGESGLEDQQMSWKQRFEYALGSVKEIIGRVWKYVILGIAVGAGIHGYVPEGYLAGIMGDSSWWSVPLSVVIGIPMYTNAAGIIPIVEALLGKGAALGTVLAFMMSVIALSFPEMVILRKVLKPKLIAAFIGVVGCGILLVGYLFNAVI
ncbi:permease [Maridesulfovibrio bastinii]|uniref:permease n=1 Tax=Maridesulfovibrio bastinii TaxID=47157 RepID=UPI0004189DF1|nr:permease [Maridesulfovibrio bastinii]